MNIEEHINNLKKYIEEDFAFREPIKNMSDFDKYCYGHCKDIETLLTAYEKEKKKNKEHKEKIIYWLDRLDLEEELQDEYDELDGCQAAVKILKQLLKEE